MSEGSGDDQLSQTVLNMSDFEVRQVLQHLCLVQPVAVQAAVSHVRQQDDMSSVVTQLISNRTEPEEFIPPPAVLSRSASGGDLQPLIHSAPVKGAADDSEGGGSVMPPVRRQPSEANLGARLPTTLLPTPSRHRPSLHSPRDGVRPPDRVTNNAAFGNFHEEIDSLQTENLATKSTDACYLVYDSDGARLTVQYSKTWVPNAVGCWTPTPPHTIQPFKFTQNQGRSELIGNCAAGVAGRKNYYSGWCQFVRAARGMNGIVTVLPRGPEYPEREGLDVTLYAFYRRHRSYNSCRVPLDQPLQTSVLDAIACLPHHQNFYHDMKIDFVKWMSEANTMGFATEFVDSNSSGGSGASITRFKAAMSMPLQSPPNRTLLAPHPPSTPQAGIKPLSRPSPQGGGGGACYLVYDPDSSGKLIVNYSRSPIANAVGKWTPGEGKKIQGFKFTQNLGRSELIGNCASGVAGRKNYYSGWCQFIRQGRALNATIVLLKSNTVHLPVDVYVYNDDTRASNQTKQLIPEEPFDVSHVLAVACLPKFTRFYSNLSVDLTKWITEASNVGAASRFH